MFHRGPVSDKFRVRIWCVSRDMPLYGVHIPRNMPLYGVPHALHTPLVIPDILPNACMSYNTIIGV